MKRIIAQIRKELTQFSRDKLTVTLALVLPAEAATKMSAPTASRNRRSVSFHGSVPPEIEKLMTSTWSAIAPSMPAWIAAPLQLVVAQTL